MCKCALSPHWHPMAGPRLKRCSWKRWKPCMASIASTGADRTGRSCLKHEGYKEAQSSSLWCTEYKKAKHESLQRREFKQQQPATAKTDPKIWELGAADGGGWWPTTCEAALRMCNITHSTAVCRRITNLSITETISVLKACLQIKSCMFVPDAMWFGVCLCGQLSVGN